MKTTILVVIAFAAGIATAVIYQSRGTTAVGSAIRSATRSAHPDDIRELTRYSIEKKWPSIEQLSKAHKLRETERTQGIYRLRGNILSKTTDGLLITADRSSDFPETNVLCTDIPIEDKLVDGDPIYVAVKLSGEYQYASAAGAQSTVRKFQFHSAPELPEKAGPNDHYSVPR